MRTLAGRVALSVCLALSAAAAAPKPGKPAKPDAAPGAYTHAVTHWKLAGPSADAFPLFHEEDRGKFGVADLLKVDRPHPPLPPDPGSEAAWSDATPGAEGRVALDKGATNEGKGYATAWLTSVLTVERFQAFDLTIAGRHPRRAFLDDAQVATGGTSKDEADGGTVKGTVKLEAGAHRLVVETVYDPERGGAWEVGATLSVEKPDAKRPPELADGVDPARALTLADVLDAPQIGSLAVSPDGASVAAGLSRYVPGTDDQESWLEVRSMDDGRLLRTWRGGSSVGQVGWAPSGRKLSYVAADTRTGGKESASLWIADLDTGVTKTVLERIENFAGYSWAPDGASIVYAVTAKADPDARGVKLRQNLLDRQAGWRDRGSLFDVTLADGRVRRLTAGGTATTAAGFSPDSKRLLVIRQIEDVSQRPYSRNELWVLDRATLLGTKVRDSGWMVSAQYSPDGKKILIVSGPSEFGDLGRTTPQGTIANDYEGELYVFDPESGLADCLSRDFDPSISAAYWNRHDKSIYVKAAAADRVGLYRYDEPGKRFVAIPTGDVVDNLSWADDASRAACTASGPWSPETLYAVDLAAGTSRALSSPSAESYASVRRGSVAPFKFTSSAGRPIDGIVYLPPGFDPAVRGRYPAIVNYYGGTLPIARDFGGRYPKEWWASHGYVVYVPQPSGAIGYGQEFAAAHVNDWGKTTVAEVIEGTKAFLAAYPAVDPKRVGAIGASYGGFMTMSLLTATDIYAAAVAHAGISDLGTYWGAGNWGYSYGAVANADSFPWNRKDIFVDRSPLFSADKVKTPLLLTHGAVDANVPEANSEAFYTALKLRGVPVELLTVDGQDHWILDHAKRGVWSRALLAWFDKWLKTEPAWWDDLFPAMQVK